MQRVLVIGSPGAGKSTFARALAEQTGLPLYPLDLIWHLPDKTTVSTAEFDRKLAEILEKDRWIIDGNYSRTLQRRLAACDTVFLLDYPVPLCLAGALSRVGHQRPDLPWLEESPDPEFLEYIRTFPEEKLPLVRHLAEDSGRPLHIFRSREDADHFLRGLTPPVGA